MKRTARVQAGQSPKATAWVGIDIAKQTFDVCLLRGEGKSLAKQFENSQIGFSQLLHWIQGHVPAENAHFCMEATGT